MDVLLADQVLRILKDDPGLSVTQLYSSTMGDEKSLKKVLGELVSSGDIHREKTEGAGYAERYYLVDVAGQQEAIITDPSTAVNKPGPELVAAFCKDCAGTDGEECDCSWKCDAMVEKQDLDFSYEPRTRAFANKLLAIAREQWYPPVGICSGCGSRVYAPNVSVAGGINDGAVYHHECYGKMLNERFSKARTKRNAPPRKLIGQ